MLMPSKGTQAGSSYLSMLVNALYRVRMLTKAREGDEGQILPI